MGSIPFMGNGLPLLFEEMNMYIIRHKITKEQLGKHYSTAGTAKSAFKTACMMLDAGKRRYLKFSEQDTYEVVKEETPEMVALEEAEGLLREAWAAGDRNVFGEDLDKRIEQWLDKSSGSLDG